MTAIRCAPRSSRERLSIDRRATVVHFLRMVSNLGFDWNVRGKCLIIRGGHCVEQDTRAKIIISPSQILPSSAKYPKRTQVDRSKFDKLGQRVVGCLPQILRSKPIKSVESWKFELGRGIRRGSEKIEGSTNRWTAIYSFVNDGTVEGSKRDRLKEWRLSRVDSTWIFYYFRSARHKQRRGIS